MTGTLANPGFQFKLKPLNMEKINLVFEFSKGSFSNYKFTSLRRLVRFLWNSAATMEFFTPMSKIPGVYIISIPTHLSNDLITACNKFGLKILEGTPPLPQEISVIGGYFEDPAFENLFREIQSESRKLKHC
jgi:hypothetical protein